MLANVVPYNVLLAHSCLLLKSIRLLDRRRVVKLFNSDTVIIYVCVPNLTAFNGV